MIFFKCQEVCPHFKLNFGKMLVKSVRVCPFCWSVIGQQLGAGARDFGDGIGGFSSADQKNLQR